MKMEEKNPLYFIPNESGTKFNKSGRPRNENLIKFSPQPHSLISQMLKKVKEEANKTKCKALEIQTDNEYEAPEDDSDTESTLESKDVNTKTKPIRKLLYPCDYPNCRYVSKLSSNLIKHRRTHTMEKPYLCDQCSFRSNFVNSLKAHKRTHTNERPYSCKHCSYRCNSSSNLKKHCKHRHWNEM